MSEDTDRFHQMFHLWSAHLGVRRPGGALLYTLHQEPDLPEYRFARFAIWFNYRFGLDGVF